MSLRVLLIIAIFGCAASTPITISEADFSLIRQRLASSLSSQSADVNSFQVSKISVHQQEVILDFKATACGNGWQRTEHSVCRRPENQQDWSCSAPYGSTYVDLPSGWHSLVVGLTGEEAASVVRYMIETVASSPDALGGYRVGGLSCLSARGDDRIIAEFPAALHHATTSYGFVYLRRDADQFVIESVTPPPSWFEGPTSSLNDCRFPSDAYLATECE